MDKKIGIVTVYFNSAPVLDNFFKSLEEQSYKNFILYAIDNHSKDNSIEKTHKLANEVSFQVKMMPQNDNYGVAKGNNIGIRAALEDNCDYILLSNNDLVLEKDAIQNLLLGMFAMGADMAVPKILRYNTNREICSTGSRFEYLTCRTPLRGLREIDCGQYDENCFLEMASTCFMMIDNRVFERVGFMDESYFVYYDDTDFVYRAVKMCKEKLCYIYNSVIWHIGAFSTNGVSNYFTLYNVNKHRMLFAMKHYTTTQKLKFIAYICINYLHHQRLDLNQHQRRIYRQAIADGYRLYRKTKN